MTMQNNSQSTPIITEIRGGGGGEEEEDLVSVIARVRNSGGTREKLIDFFLNI